VVGWVVCRGRGGVLPSLLHSSACLTVKGMRVKGVSVLGAAGGLTYGA
jgi:hypothetical protein